MSDEGLLLENLSIIAVLYPVLDLVAYDPVLKI
jgi:hypothetical protein